MALEQAQFYCPHCKQPRLFTRQGTNHVLHLLLVLFLCGLWLPIWIIIALTEGDKPYYCSQCGYSGVAKVLVNPHQAHLRAVAAHNQARKPPQFSESEFSLSDWINSEGNGWKAGTIVLVGAIIIFGGLFFIVRTQPARQNTEAVFTPAYSPTPTPEPKTSAEFYAVAMQLLHKSVIEREEGNRAIRYLKSIPKGSKEYNDAQRLLKDAKKKGWQVD